MTETAVANAVYLRALNRRETIALMGAVLIEHLDAAGRDDEANAVSDSLLSRHPLLVYAMLKQGTAYFRLLERDFYSKYPKAAQVPVEKRAALKRYQNRNRRVFARAETLGWRLTAGKKRQEGKGRSSRRRTSTGVC